jgi:hypothetical protein
LKAKGPAAEARPNALAAAWAGWAPVAPVVVNGLAGSELAVNGLANESGAADPNTVALGGAAAVFVAFEAGAPPESRGANGVGIPACA